MSIDFSGGDHTTAAEGVTAPEATGNAPTGAENTDHGGIEYNGKVLSKEEVLKKLEHADTFIEQLKAEREADKAWREQVEAKLANAGKVDQVLDALQGKKEDEPTSDAKAPTALDPNELAAQIQKQVLEGLSASKLQEVRMNNWNSVTNTLTKAYGEKVNARVQEVAAANDMSLEEAKELAHSKPKVFLNLFGLQGSTSTPAVKGSRNTFAATIQPKPASKSGEDWAKATDTKSQVSAYQARLNELLNS